MHPLSVAMSRLCAQILDSAAQKVQVLRTHFSKLLLCAQVRNTPRRDYRLTLFPSFATNCGDFHAAIDVPERFFKLIGKKDTGHSSGSATLGLTFGPSSGLIRQPQTATRDHSIDVGSVQSNGHRACELCLECRGN
jgi:hypothetical protein